MALSALSQYWDLIKSDIPGVGLMGISIPVLLLSIPGVGILVPGMGISFPVLVMIVTLDLRKGTTSCKKIKLVTPSYCT